MTTPQSHLDTLDHLLAELGRALAEQDWSRLSELNARVPAAVAPAMAALRSGELDAEAVRTRLSELQQFIEEANRQASEARHSAEKELKGLSRNRSAAQAYRNVSANRGK